MIRISVDGPVERRAVEQAFSQADVKGRCDYTIVDTAEVAGEQQRDFELQVTVRVYGPGRFSAQDAAVALRAGTGSIDMGDDAECEILAAVPLTPLR